MNIGYSQPAVLFMTLRIVTSLLSRLDLPTGPSNFEVETTNHLDQLFIATIILCRILPNGHAVIPLCLSIIVLTFITKPLSPVMWVYRLIMFEHMCWIMWVKMYQFNPICLRTIAAPQQLDIKTNGSIQLLRTHRWWWIKSYPCHDSSYHCSR